MAFMTPTEVITEAFKRPISTDLVTTQDIEIAQWKYIRPALTENLYEAVVTNTGSVYDTLIDTYIKPTLAYYTKHIIYDEIDTEISDRGVSKLLNDDTNKLSQSQKLDVKETILNKANILLDKMMDYVVQEWSDNNTIYDLYNDFTDVIEEDKIIGGILIKGKTFVNRDDQWTKN